MGREIIIIVTLTLVIISTFIRARQNYKLDSYRKKIEKQKKEKQRKEKAI